MSDLQRLIFNCGGSHVSAALVSATPTSLKFEAFAVEPLDYDATADEQWLPAVGTAVRRLANRGPFKGKASIILPGFQLLTKTLKVPHVEASRQAQVIAFEAANNMPYALNEVSWGYQIVHDDGIEVEVLLIFARRELVDAVCHTFAHAGVQPEHIQAGSLIDLAGLRYLNGGDPGNCLMINLGARSTNMLFTSEETFLVRNITTGGCSLTQSIADNLGRPPAESEQIKINTEGVDERSDDAATQTIVQNNRDAFVKRLNQDIKRSMVNFRRQPGAVAPEKILLCGRGSHLYGLKDNLESTHRLPVEILDPESIVALGAKVDQGAFSVFKLAAIDVIGEAARLVDPTAPSVDLLPGEVRSQLSFDKQKPFYAAAAAILALVAVPPLLAFNQRAASIEDRAQALERQISPIEERHEAIMALRAEAEVVLEKTGRLERLVNTRSNWIAFLADLQASLEAVDHVWLEELSWQGDRAERLEVSGRMLIFDWDPNNPRESFRRAERRFRRLMDSFEDSEFVADVENTGNIDTDQPRILGFSCTFVINPETSL